MIHKISNWLFQGISYTCAGHNNLLINDTVGCCKDMISIQERSTANETTVPKKSNLGKIGNDYVTFRHQFN